MSEDGRTVFIILVFSFESFFFLVKTAIHRNIVSGFPGLVGWGVQGIGFQSAVR